MQATQWTVYDMFSGDSQIRAKDERAPKGFRDRRTATTDEIDAEQARRAISAAANAARAAFAARQDVKDAQAVRSMIELMEPGDKLIDRLSPDEWAALRKRLEDEWAVLRKRLDGVPLNTKN